MVHPSHLSLSKMTDISGLPLELVACILYKLDEPSKLVARQVCWKWKHVLDSLLLKAHVLLTNRSAVSVQKSQLHVDTLKVRNFTVNPKRLTNRDNRLRLNPKKVVFMRRSRTLKKASVSSENVLRLLRRNCETEFVHFDFNTLAFNCICGVENISFLNLKRLKICINPRPDERENLEYLSRLTLPLLETLQIVARFQPDMEENARVYRAYYKIVANHRATLRVINLIHPICWYRSDDDTPVPMAWQDGELDALREQLSHVKLQGVYINFDKIEGRHGCDLGYRLLQHQEKLETLHVNFRENWQYDESGIRSVIFKNRSTLCCVDLIANRRLEPLLTLQGRTEELAACRNLKILRLVNFKIPLLPKLSPSLRELLLWGQLGSVDLIYQIQSDLANLERLDFFDIDGNQVGNDMLMLKFKMLFRIPRLRDIHWYKPNFDLGFLTDFDKVKRQPFVITSSWSWPLKKTVLHGAQHLRIL